MMLHGDTQLMTRNIVTSSASRQQRYTSRQVRGQIVVRIVINEDAVAERLVCTGFLAEAERYNRAAIEAALQRVIDLQFENDASLDIERPRLR